MRDDFMKDCYQPYLIMVQTDFDDERQSDFSEYQDDDITLLRGADNVLLYVFDVDDRYLGYHVTKLNKLTPLSYDKYDSIRVISICTDGAVEPWINFLTVGNKYKSDDLFLELKKKGQRDTISNVYSPQDFMFDRKHFGINPYNDKNIIYYMYVRSMVGAMKIYTNNMKEWADTRYGKTGRDEDVFEFVVGRTLDKYDFSGRLYGNHVEYVPELEQQSIDYDSIALNTKMFNMYPTILKTGVGIEIYRNGEMVYPDKKSPKKYSFAINAGWCMKVVMNFSVGGGVNIEVENWNNVDIKVDL